MRSILTAKMSRNMYTFLYFLRSLLIIEHFNMIRLVNITLSTKLSLFLINEHFNMIHSVYRTLAAKLLSPRYPFNCKAGTAHTLTSLLIVLLAKYGCSN